MHVENIEPKKTGWFEFSSRPWISLVVLNAILMFVLILVIIGANLVGIPGNAPYRPLITPTLAHILVLFIIVPFILHLPNGKSSFKEYLNVIRLTRIRPLLPIVALGVTSSLLMLFMLSANSLVYRIAQGLPVSPTFLKTMIDWKGDLPPQSLGYIVSFPAIFEEVTWRGVLLVLFMKRYSPRKSILITALGFGLFHFINLLFGVETNFVIRQVIFGSALGFFYGYLVLRSDSLMPAMLFHYLVNLFISSFTVYFQRFAPAGTQILYTAVNLPIAVNILILYVRLFCNQWIPRPESLSSIFVKSDER
jgi:membrane protease YdiL (CAAX protease family)